jgi:hypothetical protein
VTTIHDRSFPGLAVAHLAVTFGVCAGLLFVLPTGRLPAAMPTIAVVPALDCVAAAERAADHQLTGDAAALDAPNSCDDDDEDDTPIGSDAAVAVHQCSTVVGRDVLHVIDLEIDACLSRTIDSYSLRGPPAGDETSSDPEVDADDGDPVPEDSIGLPPASTGESCCFTASEFLSASSIPSSDFSLRAPPL